MQLLGAKNRLHLAQIVSLQFPSNCWQLLILLLLQFYTFGANLNYLGIIETRK